MHSFYIVSHAETYFASPEELRFNSLWPWICRMALLRRLRGWTTFQRPAGRKQDGRVWHVALLAGEGCLSWPSGCQNWLPLIAPDRRRGPGAQPQSLVIQITTAYKNAPWPHIDRLTFRMFNSYLRSCEQAVANSLPNSRSHCSTFFPLHPPWCEPEGTAALECQRWNSSEWPFDLTHHLVSAQGTHSIINNWTMVTAD